MAAAAVGEETPTDARAEQAEPVILRVQALPEQVAVVVDLTAAEPRHHGPQHRVDTQAAQDAVRHRTHSLDQMAVVSQALTAQAQAVAVATTPAVEHQMVDQAVRDS